MEDDAPLQTQLIWFSRFSIWIFPGSKVPPITPSPHRWLGVGLFTFPFILHHLGFLVESFSIVGPLGIKWDASWMWWSWWILDTESIRIYIYTSMCVYVYIYICTTRLKWNRSASSQSDRTSHPIITKSLISSPHDFPVHSSSSTIHYSFPRIHNHVRHLHMSVGFKRRIPYQDSPGDETFHFRA